ncbi:MAG: permease [Candidatus Gygaella obscura]|nr:permease [Candidatus Gygaella obscura]
MIKFFSEWFVFDILGIAPKSSLGKILEFFIYDNLKIFLLLFLMISFFGFLRSFLPRDKVKNWLHNKGIMGNIFASIFGALTPFCSCSSIPIFLGFLESGIPLGMSFSFLITSPLVNEYLVVLMFGFFGLKITLLYVLSGVLIGVIAGFFLGKINLERFIVRDIVDTRNSDSQPVFNMFIDRVKFGINEAKIIIKRLWFWIIFAIGIGALIHNYVPKEMVESLTVKTGFLGVPLAVAIGVPMYGSCAAIVPIAVALFNKGLSLGTTLSFMMAVSALSLPEAVILRRAMKLKLVFIFFFVVTAGIILTGYLFNFLQSILF